MSARRYLEIDEISNYFPMCEIIAYDHTFTNLGDLIRILNCSDRPRTDADPELKAAVYTMLRSILSELEYKVYTGHYPKPRRLYTMQEVEMYLDQHWYSGSSVERRQLLYFVH